MITTDNYLQGEKVDVSHLFLSRDASYFIAAIANSYDSTKQEAVVKFKRNARKARSSFNIVTMPFEEVRSWSFPPAYPEEPEYTLRIRFYGNSTVRLQMSFSAAGGDASNSLMLDVLPEEVTPAVENLPNGVLLSAGEVKVEVRYEPFSIRLLDKNSKELTKTFSLEDHFNLQNSTPVPFSYIRTPDDDKLYTAATFKAYPGERIYGCGESFSALDKRGQKIALWTKDAHGVQSEDMYKPIPFFMSSRGYGMFVHTSTPLTFDFGSSYNEVHTVFSADREVDMFLFAGDYKQVLKAYTRVTGVAHVPPLWSFGLWMSSISYSSEKETRAVAEGLKANQIPCDVIHLDVGWFENAWQCDYEFSHTNFNDPKKMLRDLKNDGYRISLWQLPYFTPKNKYYRELIEKGLVVTDGNGELPTADAILDFSNPKTVCWYQEKLAELLDMGVAGIKADFGEAAPLTGYYHSGRTGLFEHNLYPLRYNKAAFEITQERTGDGIIWARSAWAGSQRYPMHWGGDVENTNMGMLSSLRGGLSFGMSGFPFWSHDFGGFVKESPEELYGRWLFMGIFTSHMRCHGKPPKEPWNYSPEFLAHFRKLMEFRYSLTPYVYGQAQLLAAEGLPMMQPMCLAFPNDLLCGGIEDQFMFGEDILVAPLFENNAVERQIYLPRGTWVDLFNGNIVYEGGGYVTVGCREWKGAAFVSDGAVIPFVKPALSTEFIDWGTLKYRKYGSGGDENLVHGTVIDPVSKKASRLSVNEFSSLRSCIQH